MKHVLWQYFPWMMDANQKLSYNTFPKTSSESNNRTPPPDHISLPTKTQAYYTSAEQTGNMEYALQH
jgi:hypothetical protein